MLCALSTHSLVHLPEHEAGLLVYYLTTESATLNDAQGSRVSLCCGICQQAHTALINPGLVHQSIQAGYNILRSWDTPSASAQVREISQQSLAPASPCSKAP